MKIETQPEISCFRCYGKCVGRGSTGMMDLYHCLSCGKNEWMRRQDRRGSARKKATDDPIEVVAVSGQFDDYKLSYAHRSDKLQCSECGVESLLMDDTLHPTDGWGWWGIGCMKSPHCPSCIEMLEKKWGRKRVQW